MLLVTVTKDGVRRAWAEVEEVAMFLRKRWPPFVAMVNGRTPIGCER